MFWLLANIQGAGWASRALSPVVTPHKVIPGFWVLELITAGKCTRGHE